VRVFDTAYGRLTVGGMVEDILKPIVDFEASVSLVLVGLVHHSLTSTIKVLFEFMEDECVLLKDVRDCDFCAW